MPNRLSPIHLTVRTESGHQLGYVVDVDIDPETHQVMAYYVKSSRLMPYLVKSPLLISPTQVISVDEKEMVVEDAVAGERAPVPQAS